MRRIIVFVLPALAICLAVAISVQASPTGSQTFHNGIRVDVRRDRNYDRIGHRFWAASRESVFADMSIDNASPTDADFSNGIFGALASASMREERNDTGVLNLTLPGEWAPRTYGRVTGGPSLSEFRTGFAQTPEFSLTVGAAARSDPPAPTPEPASIMLVLSGLALGVVIYRFRRQPAMA